MRYRINRKTGDRISEIGLGTAYIYKAGTEEGAKALRAYVRLRPRMKAG